MTVQQQVMSCPLCGSPMILKESAGTRTVLCNSCAFEIELTQLQILIGIRREQEKIEKTRADCDGKIEELRRKLITLSIGSMNLKNKTSRNRDPYSLIKCDNSSW
jgi:DNA-directed RNA polymerase subunit M/transcription elongation factor TFIIS